MITSNIRFVCTSTILVSLFNQLDFRILKLTGERYHILFNLFIVIVFFFMYNDRDGLYLIILTKNFSNLEVESDV